MAFVEIAFARPEYVDVVVPGSPNTLLDIMRNYPLSWERAGNGPYFSTSNGKLIGLAAERGTVYTDYGDSNVTKKWTALYLERGNASFGAVDNSRAKAAAAAFSAGPLLVDRGGILDIPDRIKAGGFTGFDATTRKAQRALGITQEGHIADGIWEAATLYEVAEEMIRQGCVSVIKLDGGGSSGIAEWQGSKGELKLGWNTRALPAAICMQRVLRTWRPASITPKVDLDLNFEKNLTENFKMKEFACRHCGALSISEEFAKLVAHLQMLRTRMGKPINVTSGYRCAKHDYNVGTSSVRGRGPHTTGAAADIWWDGASVDEMAAAAKSVGFTGIGKYYTMGFIHVDFISSEFIG